jgi:hypothetical protein
MVSFRGMGGGVLIARVVVVVAMVGTGGAVVVSQAFKLGQLRTFVEFAFFRQLQAMWPWILQRKHLPSAWYLVHSLLVSLQKGTDILAESMSIGTCWLFDKFE